VVGEEVMGEEVMGEELIDEEVVDEEVVGWRWWDGGLMEEEVISAVYNWIQEVEVMDEVM
jgi:hypothetical protein